MKINIPSFLKLLYSKLDAEDMAEARYFMSCMVAFLVSEDIVETRGSVIDKVIADKIAFKESISVETSDITEKFVFIKLVCWGYVEHKTVSKGSYPYSCHAETYFWIRRHKLIL